MPEVFVDTVAWIALVNKSDALHAAAHQVLQRLQIDRVALVTTEFVLVEVADALSTPQVRGKTISFVNGLRRLPILTVVPASKELLDAGWQLYSSRADKDWGLTDCVSFHVMSDRRILEVFTSDSHFLQAGFVKLL